MEAEPESGTSAAKQLLLVDDQTLLAQSLARLLVRSGFAVRVVSSWMEAEVASMEASFDCGIFDIALGSDDGIALAKRLADQRRVRAVVFFSATTERATARRARAVGPLVSKDAGFEELRRVVAGCCRAS